MEQIDTTGVDADLANFLKESYIVLNNSYQVELNTDPSIRREIIDFFGQIKLSEANYTFIPKNIFRIENKNIYIIQCLLDYGYSTGRYGEQMDGGSSIQIWGYAKTKLDLGITYLRPKIQLDKFIGHFVSTGIKLNSKPFDDQYYLVSDNPTAIKDSFNEELIDILVKTKGITISTLQKKLIIGLATDEKIDIKTPEILVSVLNQMSFT